ncbi:MAG: hypothetical protein Fur0044_01030 [Anaerolineae bacterium]
MNSEAVQSYQAKIDQLLANPQPYPEGQFAGQGIVICGAGERYFPGSWVSIKLLRHLGCRLPIELWYLGAHEMSQQMIELLAGLDVDCINAHAVAQQHPIKSLDGWEIKPYAIMRSKFAEVLYLDSDNVLVKNPEFLFSTPPYQEYGALFWPDFHFENVASLNHEAWEVLQVPFRDEPPIQGGQLLIDKARCWLPLQLTLHLNEYGEEFYYALFYGDQDTFRLAWRRVKQAYAMVPYPPIYMENHQGYFQPGLDGQVLFQHRLESKWQLHRPNPLIPGFLYDAECRQFLRELEVQWSGQVRRLPDDFSPIERAIYDELVTTQSYAYTISDQVGIFAGVSRPGRMDFHPDFKLIYDTHLGDLQWTITLDHHNQPTLTVKDDRRDRWFMKQVASQTWRGRLRTDEQAVIELTPLKNEHELPAFIQKIWTWQDQLLAVPVPAKLRPVARQTFEAVSQQRFFTYQLHGPLTVFPFVPNQGIVTLNPDFTITLDFDLPDPPLGWTVVEDEPGQAVIVLTNTIMVIGSLRQTGEQSWHGDVELLVPGLQVTLTPTMVEPQQNGDK